MLRFAEAAVAIVSDLTTQQQSTSSSATATPRASTQDMATVTRITDRMDLSQFNAEQQTTIRNFLQAVGMASLEAHSGGVNIIPQSQSQPQPQPSSPSHSRSQSQHLNPSGSSATNVSEGMQMRSDGDVNIEINSGGLGNGREITLQDSLVAMRKKISLCSNLVTKYSLPVMSNYRRKLCLDIRERAAQ
jgi:hypothetical protein